MKSFDRINDYAKRIIQAIDTINQPELSDFTNLIQHAHVNSLPILVMGNGGSAALAEHLACDWTKGVERSHPKEFTRVTSLTTNTSMITAIANDYGYEEIFAQQIKYSAHRYALVLAISASGDSINICRGLNAANARGYDTLALVGFNGGAVKSLALAKAACVHVKSYDYGVVEDCHALIMHALADMMRQ